MLANELRKLEIDAEIFVSHLKPSQIELTMAEVVAAAGHFKPRMLRNNQVFEF
jgi:hypothetical protein